jgi:hypothetical protein
MQEQLCTFEEKIRNVAMAQKRIQNHKTRTKVLLVVGSHNWFRVHDAKSVSNFFVSSVGGYRQIGIVTSRLSSRSNKIEG